MKEPFRSLVAGALTWDEIESIRVDREKELSAMKMSIGQNFSNLLLYGVRGVGKTFLVRLLERELSHNFPDLLPVYVRVAGLPMYNPTDEVAAFSRAVLLQICVEIWKTVLGETYLDLREGVSTSEANIDIGSREKKTVKRVFSLLMNAERVAMSQFFNKVGFSAGVQGEKTNQYTLQKHTSDVLPFEFAEFVDELISGVLRKSGKTRIVVLCDEANQLPMFKQEDMLNRYFELFQTRNRD